MSLNPDKRRSALGTDELREAAWFSSLVLGVLGPVGFGTGKVEVAAAARGSKSQTAAPPPGSQGSLSA